MPADLVLATAMPGCTKRSSVPSSNSVVCPLGPTEIARAASVVPPPRNALACVHGLEITGIFESPLHCASTF